MRRKIPNLAAKIVEIVQEFGYDADARRNRTIYTTCPKCKKSDKFSILKENGACICYRGSCSFKGWFVDWVMQMGNMTRQQATDLIYGPKNIDPDSGLNLSFLASDKDDANVEGDLILPIKWPLSHVIQLTDPSATEGVKYLEKRGIPLPVALRYRITYSAEWRRVIFPVEFNGDIFGYQARAIDNVEKSLRMRNNSGPWRHSMFIFQNRLIGCEHAIITEGPVDAIKFDLCNGNVAASGKVISEKQLEVLSQFGIKTIYLGLDSDATSEMRALGKKIDSELLVLKVPKQTIERCDLQNKKADFGECTFEEAKQAFLDAEPLSKTIMVFLK